MAREFAKAFYRSAEWRRVREYVLTRDRRLCRICGKPAEEVHHVQHLTPKNVWDVRVTLDPDNLVSLCRDCHFAQHREERVAGRMRENPLPDVTFDDAGNPIVRGE